MKIFNLSRGQGKTIRMLYASEFNNVPILVSNGRAKQNIIDMAKMRGINIPEPITIADIVCDNESILLDKDILVDEMDDVFSQLLSHIGLNMIGATITTDKGVNING